MEIAPHNVCGPVGTGANIQRAAGIPNYRILKYFNDSADSSDDGQTTPT
jgi:galactonate dehydratase